MVATTGAPPELVAVNEGMGPLPLAANPMDEALLVQLYTIVPPNVGLMKLMAAVELPLHNTWLETGLTAAVGFTVMVKVIGVPGQVVKMFV